LSIGLEMGHSSVKMIQLATQADSISVVAADKVNVPVSAANDDDARSEHAISAIHQMLSDNGFQGRNVISCLPNDKLRITQMGLQNPDSCNIAEVVKEEAAKRFDLDPAVDQIHYVHAGNVRHGEEIKGELVLLGTNNEVITNHIALLEKAGLVPVGIDSIPHALFRTFHRAQRRYSDKQKTVVFIDVGSRFSTVVFSRDDELRFVKQIETGVDAFNREIASKLSISIENAQMLRARLRTHSRVISGKFDDDKNKDTVRLDPSTRQVILDSVEAIAEKLAGEILMCFKYYTVTFRGRNIEQGLFSGGGAYETVLVNALRRQLTCDVKLSEPLQGFDLSKVDFGGDRRSNLCEWAVPVGLSLKGRN